MEKVRFFNTKMPEDLWLFLKSRAVKEAPKNPSACMRSVLIDAVNHYRKFCEKKS
jgi:hypothetical protein